MKRCAGLAAVICLCALSLAGCQGSNVPDMPGRSAVSVSRKGQISAWFVEEFAENYYSSSELTEMAVREAAEYNASASDQKTPVIVEKVELLPDNSQKVMVSYQFDSWESYTAFNGETLFYGTVEEAIKEGFGTDVILKNIADGRLFAGDQLSQSRGRYVLITDVKADIYCPRKVTHVSDGVSVNEDGSIDTSGREGTVYILMK